MLARNWPAGLALALALVWLVPLGGHDLYNPDEGRYAEIPREMVVSGDWVTPRLNGLKYFEKPALQYWATATAYELFGVNEWSARLWSALCGLAGVFLTAWIGRGLFGARAGVLAAAVQASAVLYAILGRLLTLDMSVCFGLQLCLSGLLMVVHEPAPPGWRRAGPWVLALGVAFGMLSKGLIAILIPGAVGVLYLLWQRDWSLVLRARPWWSGLALLVLAAPWFIVVSRRNPEFAHFFFIHEHFERYLTRVHDRYEPDWYFVPILIGGFLPWTTMLPQFAREGWLRARAGDRASALLIVWTLFVFGFFSISQSKLAPYILPLIPSLALLAGMALDRMLPRRLAWHLGALATVSALLLLILLILPHTAPGAALAARAPDSFIRLLYAGISVLTIGLAAACWLARREKVVGAVLVAALGTLLWVEIALHSLQDLPYRRDLPALAAATQPLLAPDTPVYCVEDYLHTITFYMRHPCSMVGYRGELDFGLGLQPGSWLPGEAAFVNRWRATGGQALALMPPAVFARLRDRQVPMRVIYTAPSMVAVARE